MALPTIPKAVYPVVPNVAGVPPLLRNIAKVADAATFGVFGISNSLDLLIGAEPVQWGVFDSTTRKAVAVADSVIGMDYRNDARVSDYPMEQGAFASYNKVENPFDIRIRMTCGGSTERRAAFLSALEAARASLNLYTVLTPEKSYLSANIVGLDYRRQQNNGAYMMIVDLYIREIRQNATTLFSQPKSIGAVDSQSQGQVQTYPVSNPAITVRALS